MAELKLAGATSRLGKKVLGVLSLVAASALILFFLDFGELRLIGGGSGDFACYWVAVTAFLKGENPYDLDVFSHYYESVLKFSGAQYPVLAAPSALFLLSPLGTIDFNSGRKIWFTLSLLLLVCAIVLSLKRIAKFSFERGRAKPVYYLLIAISFAPIYELLIRGQFASISLIVFTVYLVRRSLSAQSSETFIDGFLIGLLCWKPHLLYLNTLYAVVRNSVDKRFGALAGFFCAGSFLYGAPLLIQEDIYYEYFSHMAEATLAWQTPTAGAWLYFLSAYSYKILFYIPAIASVLYVGIDALLSRNRNHELLRHSQYAVIGLFTAPYIWTSDFVVALPAIFLSLGFIPARSRSRTIFAIVGLNLLLWIPGRNYFYDGWYLIALCLLLNLRRSIDSDSELRRDVR